MNEPPPDVCILVADDHKAVREGLVAIIKCQNDMRVCGEACNGREAVELFRLHRPDVTLMDLRMPHMDGVSAIEAIRAEFPSACILVLTTYDAEEAVSRALAAGAAAYLLKDASRAELLATIRDLDSRQRAFCTGNVTGTVRSS